MHYVTRRVTFIRPGDKHSLQFGDTTEEDVQIMHLFQERKGKRTKRILRKLVVYFYSFTFPEKEV
jgi:hypothetical protein